MVINIVKQLRENLHNLTGLPISLTQTGKYDKLKEDEVALGALNDGAMIVNPVAMDINDVKKILNKAE